MSEFNPGSEWLARCVGDPARFFSQAWSKAPSACPGDREKFGRLLTLNDLRELIMMGAVPASRVRLVKNGQMVPERLWASSGGQEYPATGSLANWERVLAIVRQGCTLTVNGMQSISPGLFRLCSNLESELSYQVRANVYFTPPASQGMNAHYDDHDVIVLQLDGEKDWLIFDRHADDPSGGPQNVLLADDAAPVMALRLTPGDSVYIPRGFVHSAGATDQPSLHVTLGVYPPTVADLLKQAVAELAGSPALARPLGAGFARQPGELAGTLTQAAAYLYSHLSEQGGAEAAASLCRSWQQGNS